MAAECLVNGMMLRVSHLAEGIFSHRLQRLIFLGTNAAKRIDKLIKSGQYITEKQINEDIPKYLSYQEQLRIRNEKIEFLNNTTQMTPQECRQTIPKKLRYYIDTIDLYDKQKFEDNGLSELTEASELEIADFIKDGEKRQQLMDCLNEIQNKTSDVHARSNAYNIRNDLAEMINH